MREHRGHRYAQFQRALKTGNAHLALAVAAELRHIDLADALSLVLLIRDDDPSGMTARRCGG